jgi:plastocyanin
MILSSGVKIGVSNQCYYWRTHMKALATAGLILLLFSLAACNGTAPATLTQTVTIAAPTVTTTQTVMATQTVAITPTPPTTSSTHQVIIENSSYNPESITIKPGDSVTWTNKGPVPRTVTSWIIWFDEDEVAHIFIGDIFDSGDIKPGEAYSRVFYEAGLYEYASLPLSLYVEELVPAMMGSVTVREDK